MTDEFWDEVNNAINKGSKIEELVADIIQVCQKHMEPTAREHDILLAAEAYRKAYKRWEEFEANPSSALAATVYDDLSNAGSDLIDMVVYDADES